jgi:hypothetical protein
MSAADKNGTCARDLEHKVFRQVRMALEAIRPRRERSRPSPTQEAPSRS